MPDRELKQRLPYPYNQDFSRVLRRLNRRTDFGRAELAQDPVTAAYLAAAMRLVAEHVGPVAGAGEGGEEAVDRSLFSFLSQRAVAGEMTNNPEPFPRVGSVATMRSIWKTQSDFLEDLLNFALETGYYPPSYVEARAYGAEQLVDETPYADAVSELAFRVASVMAEEMMPFRLQLIATACAERNEAVRAALAAKYRRGHAVWRQLYQQIHDERRLRLREGMTLDQLTVILTSLVEGIQLRAIADPSDLLRDPATHQSLLGTATLAILNGCVLPVDKSDDQSVVESLEAKVTPE